MGRVMAGVDVVIPCYRHGRFLRSCVDSIMSQGIDTLRILIVDNASDDGSADVARRLAREEERIHLILREANLGPHASFNEGVDWASAPYMMILCADDLLAPGALVSMLSVMEANTDVVFAYGNDVHWDGEGPYPVEERQAPAPWTIGTGRDFILETCRMPERYIAAGMVLVRTCAHKNAGHYRTTLPHTDDLEMLLRLALLGRVARTPTVVGVKRMHGDNRTNAFLSRDLVERVAALESFFGQEGGRLEDADVLLRLGRRRIAERAYWSGAKQLSRGRKSGLQLIKLALGLAPGLSLVPPLGYLARTERPLMRSVFRG
ncbi:glycosyltransferase family 2 protein [Mesorhizobium xinjiangense]|uniref:glycosyltransferase family 2 protein n=1 Tax=Mesorhizobium xinjiangense TaxID=2678685 RepID=UPI001F2ECDDB|nr:glycosyltransferase family A protein [Mesorhizobium xinjiangense]